MTEIWRDIKDYENLYQVSNLGRVKSLDKKDSIGRPVIGKVLKYSTNKEGYKSIILCKNGKIKSFKVHRLVANAFIPNPMNKPEVNHIDNDKNNNRIDNLEWVTHLENMIHAHNFRKRQFLKKKTTECKYRRGEKHPKSKLTKEQVHWIREHYIPFNKLYSQGNLARLFNVSQRTIGDIVNNISWKE